MNDRHDRPSNTVEEPALVQLIVCNSEEDEAEEGVESCTQERQEVTHAWNDLSEDEGDEPDDGHHCEPYTPSDDGVAVAVSRVAHDAFIDELGADVGVDDTDDKGRYDDEAE